MARLRLPAGVFELALQVRSYEVGREGYVRPANLLRYFEYLATEASAARGFDHTWYEQQGTAFVVREMRLVAGRLPQIGERLRMATWLSSYGRVQAYREYALWREEDSRLLARAQGRWAYVDRVTGQLRRLPNDMIARFGSMGYALPSVHLPEPPVASERRILDLSARTYEADSNRHVNNAVYMDWLEDATALALGTKAEEMPHAAQLPLAQLRRLHLEYLRPAMPGDHISAHVAPSWVRQRGLMADYELRDEHGETPVVRGRALFLYSAPTVASPA